MFDIEPGVSAADQSVIREGLDLAQRFFQDVFGRPVVGSIVAHITAQAGSNPAFAGNGMITFNTAHQVWSSTANLNKTKISIHELFHLFQEQNGLQGGNPRWFVEGSAEFVGYQGTAYAGMLPYSTARGCQLFSMRQGVDPSLTLRDGGIPPSNGYWLAFMGIDYMSNSDVRTFARIVNSAGLTWDAKLFSATGINADQFYTRFEEQRRQYSIPSSYDCPR